MTLQFGWLLVASLLGMSPRTKPQISENRFGGRRRRQGDEVARMGLESMIVLRIIIKLG